MQKQVKEIMNLKTSSSHRESTPFGIRKQKIFLEEAFRYPVTKLPLSISEGISNLRSGSKSTFRNHLSTFRHMDL